MLASSLRSMMGGGSGNQQSFGDTANHSGGIEDRRPWGGDQSGGNLAREAGINDIGSSGQRADNSDSGSRQGFFDQGSYDDDGDDMDHDGDGFDGDGGRRLRVTGARSGNEKRPPHRAAVFCEVSNSGRCLDQITTTLAPTLTRP